MHSRSETQFYRNIKLSKKKLNTSISFSLSFFFWYIPSVSAGLTLPGFKTQMPIGQMPVGVRDYGPHH